MENVKFERKNAKALKLVVCMTLIVALAISALSFSVRATYENTHGNTGNQASDIVGIATTQVGYGEGGDGYTKYGDWYGLPYSDWCAMFVSWCANQAGVSTDVFPSFALCSAGADWFISQGRFEYAGSYTPHAGDLIFYSSYGDIYHVGLVTGADDTNVYSIEGNYCEAVYNVSYPLSYGDILGYATPDYETASETKAAQTWEEPEDEDSEDVEEIEEVVEDTEEVSDEVADYEYDEDETYEDATDEDATDEDVTDEDATDEDVTDEDATDEEVTDEETTDEDVTDEETTDEDAADEDAYTAFGAAEVVAVAGDVNGDGVADSTDALLIQRYLAQKLGESDEFDFLGADADSDGEITVHDALYVLELSVGA